MAENLNLPFPKIRFKSTGLIYQESINEKQKLFHETKVKFRAVQAAVGSGKTVMANIEALRHSWRFRNNLGFIVRQTLPQAQISSIPDLEEVTPAWMIRRWNSQDKIMRVLNQYGYNFIRNEGGHRLGPTKLFEALDDMGGMSTIVFTSFVGTIDALNKWDSANLGWFFIDQAEKANFAINKALIRRMRRVHSARQAWYIANFRADEPYEDSWLWRYFSDDSPEKKRNHWYMSEMPTIGNIGNVTDDYIEAIKDTHTEAEIAQYLEGDIDKLEVSNAVFTEFSHEHNVLDEHIEPKDEWVKGIGLDPGLHNPCAFVQAAILPTGEFYFYSEYEETQKLISEIAYQIIIVKTPNHRHFFIDATGNNRNQVTGTSPLDELVGWGLPFEEAPRPVMPRVMRMKEYMKYDPNHINPFTGKKGSPRFFVSPKCPLLRRAIGSYRYEQHKTHTTRQNAPEKFEQHNDHLPDAAGFLLYGVTLPMGLEKKGSKFPKFMPKNQEFPNGIPGLPTMEQTIQLPNIFGSEATLDFSKAYVHSTKTTAKPRKVRQTSYTQGSRGRVG